MAGMPADFVRVYEMKRRNMLPLLLITLALGGP